MKYLFIILLLISTLQAAPALVLPVTKAQTGSPVTEFDVSHTVAEGNTIILSVAASTSGINFTATNTTTGLALSRDVQRFGGGIDNTIAIFSTGHLAAGTHTINVRPSASEFVRYAASEWSGIADTDRVIDTSDNAGVAQDITTGDVTTGVADTLLFAAVRTDGDESAHGDIGVGTNFTLLYPYAAVEPEQKLMCEYRIVSAGTYGNGFTLEASDGGGWVAGLVAYAADGGGGGTSGGGGGSFSGGISGNSKFSGNAGLVKQ